MLKKSAGLIVTERRWRLIGKPVELAAVGDKLNLIFCKEVELACKLILMQVMGTYANREGAKRLACN